MKKIFYLFAIFLGTIIVGCNPMEDIHNDANANNPGVVQEVQTTLTDDDYDELGLPYGSFSSEEDAKSMLPDFLADKYPYLSDGSSVQVGYMLYIGSAEGVSDLTSSDVYQLTNSDYASTGSDAFGFYPNTDAASKIPDVLEAQIASPAEGQIVLAKYKQYLENPVVGLANIVEYNFAGSFEGWTVVEESGSDDVWTSQSGYVQGNGFFGGAVANVEWLVSPSIDLTNESNLKFQIAHALKYATDTSLLKILVSTDYTGDTAAATWDEITLATPPGVDDFNALSEDYDFSAYDGQTINIAFKYESTDSDAGRWRISSLALKVLGATGDTNSKGEYFTYSGGSWVAMSGVYYLSSEDYDSMGEASGQPGKYNNFGSSIPPNNYLPTFMSLKFPYGQEDDEILIIYDYFSSSSGAQRRGNLYTFIERVWTAYQSTIATTLQFGLENGTWVPDNTIRYTFTTEDYTFAGEALLLEPGFENAAANLLSYGNFNRQGGATGWSTEMMVTAIGIVLDNIDPSAAEGQKYLVTVDIYNSGNGTENFSLIKTGGEWVAN